MTGRSSKALIDLLTPMEIPGLELERWGSNADGGYIIPARLMEKAVALLSGGVGDNVEFESEVASRLPSIRIGMFDHTISSLPSHAPVSGTWYKRGLGTPPEFLTLEQAVTLMGAGPSDVLAVKLDIEGAEWKLLHSTPEDFWKRVAVFVVEFHDLNDKQQCRYYASVLEKINPYLIPIHVHGNNHAPTVHFSHQGVHIPVTLEVTYVNRTLIPGNKTPSKWNHPAPTILDRPNKNGIPATYSLTIGYPENLYFSDD